MRNSETKIHVSNWKKGGYIFEWNYLRDQFRLVKRYKLQVTIFIILENDLRLSISLFLDQFF